MTHAAPKIAQTAREHGEQIDEEILWLRSFGWSNERIAKRLGVTVDCIQKHDRKRAA